MSDARLMNQLNVVTSRLRRLRAIKASLACWTIIAISLLVMNYQGVPRQSLISFLAGGIVASILISLWIGRSRSSDRTQAAMEIEKEFPELDAMLLTCLQQKPSSEKWEFSFLQSELMSRVLEHSRINNWSDAIYGLNHYRLSRIFAMLTCLLLIVYASPQLAAPVSNPLLPVIAETPTSPFIEMTVTVEPGDTEVEQGTSLLVLARFEEKLPTDVTLVATDHESRQIRIPLNKSLDDPIYGGRIPNIDQDLTYHVEFDAQTSDDYSVTTFTYPELVKADAEIEFPTYTELESETLEDVRRLSVVEGSNIYFDFLLSKELKSAAFVGEDGERIELTADSQFPNNRTLAFASEQPEKRKYQLELVDLQERKNRNVPEFVIQVLPNLPPKLKVEFPSRDQRISPIEELALQANASDDFGLVEYGLIFEKPTGEQESVNLKDQTAKSKKSQMDHLLAVATLKVEPEQLISYYFYADDIGPDGQQRRAFSDIFFSEVRHFEEIYREVPSQPSQQQQQQEGTESGKLLEVQRQIVSATWNLIRSESRTTPSEKFLSSAQVLFESQEQALTMAEEMLEKIEDEEMKRHLNAAMELMTSTSGYFAESIAKNQLSSLHDGRSKAQAAYQALLKLNSREKKVQQQQQSQSQSSQSKQQDRNRQLKALELKNDRDRYETERQAQQQEQQQEKRETLQVLNRLRELARRQEDLNEKIRELENKLREAETEEEKKELERELKRLQEEQEELLRNLDEVQERMNRKENRERMADAREQVEKTRERVLRASEALKEQQTSRALTEGKRAERELNELKEEFKNQSSSQFEDAVRDLRNDVRELAKDQESVSEAMQGEEKTNQETKRQSLRPDEPAENREEIAQALEQQKEKLSSILDRTKELVQESEANEPLLSQKLYDTMRDLRKFEPEEALKGAAQLQRYGIEEEAKKLEAQAQQGIQRLEQGVDDAAQSILGDEGEALAAASEVLDELTRAIENELQANAEQNRSPGASSNPTTTEEEGSKQSPGKPGENGKSTTPANSEQEQGESSKPADSKPGSEQQSQEDSQQKSDQPGKSQSKSGEPSPEGGSPMPGESQSRQQSSTGKPGEGKSPSDSQGQQPSQSKSQPGQQQGSPSSQPGQSQGQPGQSQGGKPSLGEQIGNLFQESGSEQSGSPNGDNQRTSMPLTGEEYREWSDQMRDLEEMVPSTELRSQVATIRERARQMRIDLKRHSKAPDMDLVQTSIYGPMVELQQVIAEELARRNPNEKLVPIDRDPVPEKYSALLQKYYEELARQRTDRAE